MLIICILIPCLVIVCNIVFFFLQSAFFAVFCRNIHGKTPLDLATTAELRDALDVAADASCTVVSSVRVVVIVIRFILTVVWWKCEFSVLRILFLVLARIVSSLQPSGHHVDGSVA